MLKLVKAGKIKLHIEKETLQYLRFAKIVTKFIEEVRKCDFDFDRKPKLTIKSIDWNSSIYGNAFWSLHYWTYQHYKRNKYKT